VAGAFLHWRKNRRAPAKALFRLARTNLSHYPDTHLQLHTLALLQRIEQWIEQLENDSDDGGIRLISPQPILSLERAV
jgi:hypothetical protein